MLNCLFVIPTIEVLTVLAILAVLDWTGLKTMRLTFAKPLGKFNLRLRYPLTVILLTFFILHVFINDSVEYWVETTPRDAGRYIRPNENTTLIFPNKLRSNVIRSFDVVIFVTSDPRNIERRNAIRQSWGSVNNQVSDLSTCIIFFLGLTKDPQVCE